MAEEPQYVALYNKYRPKRFVDVAQRVVTRVLLAQIKGGSSVASYLFQGPPGTGKTSLARIMAMALQCPTPQDGEPCGKCASCDSIARDASRDVIEINCATHGRVEDVRDMIAERVRIAPSTGKYRIFILDESQLLTPQAQAACLKVLEEPPLYAKFFLCTTDPHKVLPAIRTRCQCHALSRVSDADLGTILRKVVQAEHMASDEAAIDLIVQASAGSARTALAILEHVSALGVTEQSVRDVLGRSPKALAIGLLRSIQQGDRGEALRILDAASSEGRDLGALIEECARLLMLVARMKLKVSEHPELAEFAQINGAQLVDACTNLIETTSKIRQNATADLIAQIGLFKTIDRFGKLEEQSKKT